MPCFRACLNINFSYKQKVEPEFTVSSLQDFFQRSSANSSLRLMSDHFAALYQFPGNGRQNLQEAGVIYKYGWPEKSLSAMAFSYAAYFFLLHEMHPEFSVDALESKSGWTFRSLHCITPEDTRCIQIAEQAAPELLCFFRRIYVMLKVSWWTPSIPHKWYLSDLNRCNLYSGEHQYTLYGCIDQTRPSVSLDRSELISALRYGFLTILYQILFLLFSLHCGRKEKFKLSLLSEKSAEKYRRSQFLCQKNGIKMRK